MSESDRIPKIDVESVKRGYRDFMKFTEQQNLERVQKLKRVRQKNVITGCLLGAGVLSIYAYTLLSIKQEVFLDDFNEPEKTVEHKQ